MKAARGGVWWASLLAAGCSLAPPYHVPETPAVAQFKEAAAGAEAWGPAEPADHARRGDWWTHFHDPVLTDLVGRALAANQSLKVAEARYRQARSLADQAEAALFPVVDLSAAATRSRASENLPRINPGGPTVGSNYSLRAQLGYELDFWGRVRNAVSSAASSAQASAADLETARLSLQAELAADWFALRGLDAQVELLDQTVESFAEARRITRNRFEGGAAPIADLHRATTQLEDARVLLADARLQRARMEHAIAILVGEAPSLFTLPAAPLDLEPPALAVPIPSRVLERRPDVASAERRVAAANARIGVARAAWFPEFTLGLAYGYASTRSSDWLTAPSRLWSIGPQALLTLFDGGRRRALEEEALASHDEMTATYRQTVLNAYGEVEDQLAAIRWLDEQRAAQRRAVESSAQALEQANYRYRGGIANYLEVTTAQTAALQARQADLNLRVRRLAATVGLVKAIGGDWHDGPQATASRAD